jgi:23S rRNA pseudouridine955/2504/2580 synthase
VTKEVCTFTAPLPPHMAATWKALEWSERDAPADPFAALH